MAEDRPSEPPAGPPPAEGASEPPPPPPPPPPPKQRKWLPTFGVLLLIAVVSLGGFVGVGALEETSLRNVDVAEGLVIHPPDGWQVVEELTQPVAGLRLSRGPGNLDVFAATTPAGFTAADLYLEYMAFLAGDAEQFRFTESPDAVEGVQGVQGLRGFYVGAFPGLSAPIEGEVFSFVTPEGIGIVFDGWAAEGQYGSAAADAVREMVATAEVTR